MKEFQKYEIVKVCDLCGSNNIQEYYKPSDLMRCNDCSFLFISPRPSLEDITESYSAANYYDGWISESRGRWKMWEKRYKRITKYISSSSRILDFSSGIGTFMQVAKLNGHTVYGTEISDSAKKIALDTYGIELFDSNFYFSDAYADYFDVITAWHVLEHVPSPKYLVQEFFRILRPGGMLFVAVPNAQFRPFKNLFGAQKMNLIFPKLTMGDEIHLSQFTEHTLTFLLESAGFSVIETGIDDYYPNPNLNAALRYSFYVSTRYIMKMNIAPTIYFVAKK